MTTVCGGGGGGGKAGAFKKIYFRSEALDHSATTPSFIFAELFWSLRRDRHDRKRVLRRLEPDVDAAEVRGVVGGRAARRPQRVF